MATSSSPAASPAAPKHYRRSLKLQSVLEPLVQEELDEDEEEYVNVQLRVSRLPEGEGSDNVNVRSREISIELIEVELLRDDDLFWYLRVTLFDLGVRGKSNQDDIIIDLFRFIHRRFIDPKIFNVLDTMVVMNITEEREGPAEEQLEGPTEEELEGPKDSDSDSE